MLDVVDLVKYNVSCHHASSLAQRSVQNKCAMDPTLDHRLVVNLLPDAKRGPLLGGPPGMSRGCLVRLEVRDFCRTFLGRARESAIEWQRRQKRVVHDAPL